jgi:hypothetical protein
MMAQMKARDLSDGITAYLQGGLGNQLFIYAAALEQSRRLRCALYLDVSHYIARDPLEFHAETPREYELGGLNLPGIVVGLDSPWLRNSPRRPSAIRRLGRKSRFLRVHRQVGFGYSSSVNLITPGTTMHGYFQAHRYFSTVSDEVHDLLLAAPLTVEEQKALESLRGSRAINAHARRGDYVQTGVRDFHGMTTTRYFADAFKVLGEIMRPDTIRIFTDSPEYVRTEFAAFTDVEFFDDSQLSTFGSLRALSTGQAIVMSNSSFSWWAAWLMTQQQSLPVVAPRPWQANGESALDLILPTWLTLDARD